MYAEILINLSARQLDRTFSYLIPERLKNQVVIGSLVQVPFRKQKLNGYVVGLGHYAGVDEVKEIISVVDRGPVFNSGQLALARWMASCYLCPTINVLQTIISPRLVSNPRKVKRLWPSLVKADLSNTPAQAKVIQVMLIQPGLTRQELARTAGVSAGTVDALISKGLLLVKENLIRRNPLAGENYTKSKSPALTLQQKMAQEEIFSALQKGVYKVFLLYGVTGSGKTEVYCQGVAQTLKLKRQAMILVPEIALTPQIIETFKSRFGEQVAILHSRLSDGERYDEWMRINSGDAKVVLGTRSAVFAPLSNIGLIIIDEEHEPSYKQEENPRYHARTVALRLAKENDATVILGSATPSLESFYQAYKAGTYHILRMSERVENRPLPQVRIVDMRKELSSGNKGIFSRYMLAAIQKRLARKEQVILFLNRRGYSTFVVCRECGLVMKCPHCDLSLTYHSNARLICHFCNYTILAPKICPKCRSRFIGYFGTGTQKIEQEIKNLFPGARALRLDRDTTTRKGSHGEILHTFRQGGADILIGTQMIAKGLDIPKVTLVGVINADISLYMPDFRASERTFQLLTQVAGRAGRSELGGEVVVQTYSPEHYVMQTAKNHDYEGFYQQEISIRKALNYPPFTNLCRFILSGKRQEEVKSAIDILYKILKERLQTNRELEFLGPAPAPISKIKDYYRWHLVLKASNVVQLRELVTFGLSEFDQQFTSRQIRIIIDMEPQSLM